MDNNAKAIGLEQTLRRLLDRRRTQSTLRNLTLPKPGQVDFSSNDFLSLSTSPLLKSAYLDELQKASLPLGSGGSRLLDGNSAYAEELEHDIAAFHGAETGLLFNSGFDANVGFFSSVPQPGDVVVYDELVHASVHDGMKLSRAGSTIVFRHNCVAELRRVLVELKGSHVGVRQGVSNVFVAVESIYSMDGDVAPLQDIVDVAEDILGSSRSYVIVDEAHSTGVLGPQGRGLVSHLGLENRIFARLHTFGKALAANGAILLGSSTLRHYLINYARPLIYTTFLSYPSLALTRSSYSLLQSGQSDLLQSHLHLLTQTLYAKLEDLWNTCSHARRMLKIPSVCPSSPIFAVQLVNPKVLASSLQNQGMMVRAVVPPTVPPGTERVRICLHAGNTVAEVERLVLALRRWCESQAADVQRDECQDAPGRARL
ncbi:uncharacterized protein yc1106_05773 [Curvularia clavata]|uniref:Aminotransferase class I/classII large domain-containing protein n=1 Tax=Curvularia clavata TaxID=95742 RepID=A0A9Q8ZBM8_CURCL|nr:uncharacterized protein yc1106_05773 [Curvularia clavata]